MNTSVKNDRFDRILENYPEFLTRSCMIKLGIWPNKDAAWQSQYKGNGPSYVKIGRKILYPKQDVISWLKSSYREVEK